MKHISHEDIASVAAATGMSEAEILALMGRTQKRNEEARPSFDYIENSKKEKSIAIPKDPIADLIDTLDIACRYHKGGLRYSEETNYDTIYSQEKKFFETGYVDNTGEKLPSIQDMLSHFEAIDGITHTNRPRATYELTFDQLNNINLSEFMMKSVEDTVVKDAFWCIDVAKNAVKVIDIRLSENTTRYNPKTGEFESSYNRSKKELVEAVKDVLRLNRRNEIDKRIISLMEYIAAWYLGEEMGINDIHCNFEKELKEEILAMDMDTFKSLTAEYTPEELAEWNFSATSITTGATIIRAVIAMIESGVTPQSLGLTDEDDWTKWGNTDLNDTLPEDLHEIEEREDKNDREEAKTEYQYKKIAEKTKGNKRATKAIVIRIKSNGKIKEFDTKGDCMRFLGISFATFSKFLKGKSTANKKYEIVSIG